MGIHSDVVEIMNKKTDLIIHPSILQGYFVNELLRFYISNKQSIPLIFLMNSWDNPSSKVLRTGKPSKLVVWGQQSKNHAVECVKNRTGKLSVLGQLNLKFTKQSLF